MLRVFFATHDPTTLNRQGNDIGTQYRSAIFFTDENQRKLVNSYIENLTKEEVYASPILTEVLPASTFYPAEVGHKAYYANNLEQTYCSMVIAPKLERVHRLFAEKLKK